jgi:hypothetical protein
MTQLFLLIAPLKDDIWFKLSNSHVEVSRIGYICFIVTSKLVFKPYSILLHATAISPSRP